MEAKIKGYIYADDVTLKLLSRDVRGEGRNGRILIPVLGCNLECSIMKTGTEILN